MTPRQLHADAEAVGDADLLRDIARKSFSAPICDQCALANGAIEPTREIIGLSKTACCVCSQVRMCSGLRDWRWSPGVWGPRLALETK